jgi:hypothetical protein
MKSMRQLINLMEGVVAIPGVGRQLDEKSTSEKQARFMAAAAHDPAFAKKTGMDTSVAKEFNKADTGTKQLSNAMKHKKEESVDEAQVDNARMSNPRPAVDILAMEEGARPGTYEVPTAWRKSQGQAPLTPQDVQRHDTQDKISHRDTLAQNSGRTPQPQEECSMVEGEGSRAGEWAMMRFGELTNSFVEPEEAMSIVMRELQSQGVSVEDLADAEEAIMSMFGQDDGDMGDGEPQGSYDMSDDADALASAGHGSDEDYGDYGGHDEFEEEFDLNNGYGDVENASGNDFFPTGADSPVVRTVGPSGARQGDNPEQKKMQVAEVHKELVYGYRNYLKETALVTKKKS